MDYKTSIEGGVVWLFSRAFRTDSDPLIPGPVITGWRSWEEAISDYNGGGVDNYFSEVKAAYHQLNDWLGLRKNRPH
jgi:hypothetical protein